MSQSEQKIQDRIKSLRRIRAGDLLPNPANWRNHPREQRDAVQGLLASIGHSKAAIGYETKRGVQLIDGHLRASLDPDERIPVLMLDITAAEGQKLLATHDPIGMLATSDSTAMRSLLDRITPTDETTALFDTLNGQYPRTLDLGDGGQDATSAGNGIEGDWQNDGEEIEVPHVRMATVIMTNAQYDAYDTLVESARAATGTDNDSDAVLAAMQSAAARKKNESTATEI